MLISQATLYLMMSFQFCKAEIAQTSSAFNCGKFKSILQAFITPHIYVNVISSMDRENYIVDKLFRCIIERDSRTVFTLNAFDVRKAMNIIMVDSFESFRSASRSPAINNKNVHVVVFFNQSQVKSNDIFKVFREKNILEVYIVHESEESVLVTTFNPFAEGNCNDLSPMIISNSTENRNSSKSWIYSPKKLNNFFMCPIRFGIYINLPFIMANNDDRCDLRNFKGRDIFLLKALAKALNFTVDFKAFETQDLRPTIASLQDNTSDVIIGDFFLRYDRLLTLDSSAVYYSAELGFIVPNGRHFTSLESFSNSFQLNVWILITTTLFIAVFIICAIKFQPLRVRNFVFGSTVHSPLFNLFEIVFGISQKRLPARNFARFILTCFILFCLVIRSLYQGAAYHFLKSDMHRKAVETIDEIVEQDFLIYVFNETVNIVNHEKIDKSKIKPISILDNDRIMENLKDPSFNGVLVRSTTIALFHNHVKKYDFIYATCKQPLVVTSVVLYLQKGSFLTEAFNEKLQLLNNAGLIEYWEKLFLQAKVETTSIGPIKLTLSSLLGIFQIWITGCFIAIVVFIIEQLKFRFYKKLSLFRVICGDH